MSGQLEFHYSIFIAANPERVWDALTRPEFSTQYFPNGSIQSTWEVGSDYRMARPDGATSYEGKVVEADPPRRLVQTCNFRLPEFAGHQEMTIGWDIQQFGEASKLTIWHVGSRSDAKLFALLTGHCPDTASGIKTLLETGKPLHIGEPVAAKG